MSRKPTKSAREPHDAEPELELEPATQAEPELEPAPAQAGEPAEPAPAPFAQAGGFDQYYPGGVMKQMADAAGIDVRALNPNAPGGVMEQLRVAADPGLELSQHGPGGPVGQIGYTLVGAPLEPGPTGPTGPGEPPPGETTSPGPQPRSAGITGHDAVSLFFDLPLDTASVPAFADFSVMCDATPADVDTVAVTGSQVDLVLMEDLPTGIVVMAVSYGPGADSPPLQGKDGTPVAPFESFPVDVTAAP